MSNIDENGKKAIRKVSIFSNTASFIIVSLPFIFFFFFKLQFRIIWSLVIQKIYFDGGLKKRFFSVLFGWNWIWGDFVWSSMANVNCSYKLNLFWVENTFSVCILAVRPFVSTNSSPMNSLFLKKKIGADLSFLLHHLFCFLLLLLLQPVSHFKVHFRNADLIDK